jgi:hypothetical protein
LLEKQKGDYIGEVSISEIWCEVFSAAIAGRESVDGSFDSCGEAKAVHAAQNCRVETRFLAENSKMSKKMHYGDLDTAGQAAKVNGFRSNSDML